MRTKISFFHECINKILWLFFLIFIGIGGGLASLHGQDLEPGDGVRLTFYNIPDAVSGDYFVQKDSTIQFPFIGVIRTRGRTFSTIKAEITKKYRLIYREPELNIQPLFKINVLGEVRKPGIYYLTGVEKFSDLLAMAGGETPEAKLTNIYLIRQEEKIKIDAKNILQKGRSLNDIGLQSGDRVYVPRKRWLTIRNASVLISAMALAVTVIDVFLR